jgi:N-acetylneuraminate synthase
VKIANRSISKADPPFVVAEMSGNHNQSLDRAINILEKAVECGADAIKLQTYTPDQMTLDIHNNEFLISEEDNPWTGNSLYKLYEKSYTPLSWHEPIITRANELGVICFSSVFDDTAVDCLEDLNIQAYKIASSECTDIPLIKKVAETKKPIIVSVGMASLAEIDEAVDTIISAGNTNYALLKCTVSYPTNPENSNISTISYMRKAFDCEVGISDHTLGIGVSLASIAFGATIIEKHFTLDKSDGGVDSFFSLDARDLQELVTEAHRVWQSIGHIQFGPTECEEKYIQRRRSLYIGKDMEAGEVLTRKNLRRIRPGIGLSPRYFDQMLGRKVNRNVKKGTPFSFDLI